MADQKIVSGLLPTIPDLSQLCSNRKLNLLGQIFILQLNLIDLEKTGKITPEQYGPSLTKFYDALEHDQYDSAKQHYATLQKIINTQESQKEN